jgi:uncharacterized protein YqgC (DUF456 family)
MAVDIIIWTLSGITVIAGLAGMLIPVVPGAPLLLAGLVGAAWAEDFQYVGVGTIAVLTVIALLTYAVDLAAGAFGAKRFGASRRAVIGATVGTIVGLFFGIAGILLGPFLGAMAGELSIRQQGMKAAGWAGVGTTIGIIVGTVMKIALAFSMLGIYLAVRLY